MLVGYEKVAFFEANMNRIVSWSKRVALVLSVALLVISTLTLGASSAAAETYSVKMGSDNGMLKFDPPKLTIKAGDSVNWVNNKLAPHNAVFDKTKVPEGVDAAAISHKKLLTAPGDSYSTTFDTPGTYTYYCEPHRGAGMMATITVE